ncbi:MAG: TonB family protein [Rhodospirillaceae bacterium]|nr:TonB family protein [Rhodospirillaceae bacterium]
MAAGLANLNLSVERSGRGMARWLGAGILMVGLHASGAAIGMMQWQRPAEPPATLPPAVMIDLQPVMTPVPPPQRLEPAPEPEVVEQEIDLPQLAELEDLPLFLPVAQPVVEVTKKERKKEEKEKEAKKPEQKQEKKEASKKLIERKPEKKKPADVKSAPVELKTATDAPAPTKVEVANQQAVVSAMPVGPTPAELAVMAQAKASWGALANAHLIKHRKYPRAAQRRNQTGSPVVSFRVDRGGNVLGVKLVRSSGHDALDEEALALFWRATPLPALPPEIPGAIVESPIAINFSLQ